MSSREAAIHYRPYLDGLRGIAILAVVLYHAKLLSITGGFIGVDVFFVISGYLITSIIVRDVQAGVFTLAGFWERRVRRIIPALFAVILCTTIVGYALVLYPPDYRNLGTAVIGQSMFVSNMVFMTTDNYFDQPSRYSPLLHTWSLSVEEQFYLLFPLLILFCVWFVKRYRNYFKENYQKILLWSVIALAVASFLLNMWMLNAAHSSGFKIPFLPEGLFQNTTYAMAGFYLALTRIWELALGIIIALRMLKVRSAAVAETLSFVGVAAIGVSLFLFNNETSFPGVAALLPTLGVVAVIVANENYQTKMGALLSHSVLVWIGLISYSLYLWHWPLFVFAGLASPTLSSKSAIVGLIALSVTLAWLSWRFIERPFRKKIFLPGRKGLFVSGFAAMALLVVLGVIIQQSSAGQTDRIPASAKEVLLVAGENIPWGGVCFQIPGDESRPGGFCRIGDTSRNSAADNRFVVWGDSHAEALVPLLNTMGRAYGAQGVVFDGAFCIPVEGVHHVPPATGCTEKNAFALRYIRDNDIKNIILIARWSYYVQGGQNVRRVAFITDSSTISTSPGEAGAVFERNFIPMIEQLSREGRKVTIVKQVPEQFEFSIRDTFYRAVHSGEQIQFGGISTIDHETYQAPANAPIDRLRTLPGVRVVDPAEILCEKGSLCGLEKEERLVYRDEDHVSTVGAMSLEPLLTSFFKSMR